MSNVSYGNLKKYFSTNDLKKLYQIPDLELRALSIVGRVYAEHLDLSGNAETGHFIRIAEQINSPLGRVVALLHDIVEDGYLTLWDLLGLFPMSVISSLQILCRDKEKYPHYVDYVASVLHSNDIIAIEVKLHDIGDNLSPRRILELDTKKQKKLYKKYCETLPLVYEVYNKEIQKLSRKRRKYQ